MAGITFSEGSGLQDSIYGKSQAPIRMFMEKRAEAFEQKSLIDVLFNVGTSKHWGEKFTSMTAMDGFQPVGENGEYPMDNMQEGYSKFLEHMTWKDSFSLSREIIDDATEFDLKKKPRQFIDGYYRTREVFGAMLYGAAIKGDKTVNYYGKKFDVTTADGKTLFNTEHTQKVAKNKQSNMFADAFSVDALGEMESKMQDFRGDNDEILAVAPNTILIPNIPSLKKEVFAAIGAEKDPNTANNGFNYQFGRWNVIVWQYLNKYVTKDSKPWMLLDTEYMADYDGAVWLDRIKLEVRSELASNDANVWKGYSRFIAGFVDWRFAAIGGVDGGTQLIA